MDKNIALLIAGIVFSLVSFAHLLRIFMRIDILVGTKIIPMWVSWIGFLVALILAILMFVARKRSW